MEKGEGRKDDKSKPPVMQILRQFPDAIAQLAKVSEYGHKHYGESDNNQLWDNWRHVDNAKFRYEQALGRHILYQSDYPDKDSGLMHIVHAAWNALAIIQLTIEEQQATDESGCSCDQNCSCKNCRS
jgi:hypothetical protein